MLGSGSSSQSGKVKTEEYRYFANAAYAICEGPITRIGRIWATWDDGAGEWVSAAPAGGDPVTLEPEGEWDNGATYAKLDVVSFAGSSYVSRLDSNIGNQPDQSLTQWMVLAEKGEAGRGAI